MADPIDPAVAAEIELDEKNYNAAFLAIDNALIAHAKNLSDSNVRTIFLTILLDELAEDRKVPFLDAAAAIKLDLDMMLHARLRHDPTKLSYN